MKIIQKPPRFVAKTLALLCLLTLMLAGCSDSNDVNDTAVVLTQEDTIIIDTTPVAAPVETTPADAEPVDTTPVIAAPVETTPADAEPVETTPVDAAPVETTPADAEPVETTPVDAAPVDTTPVDAAPVETTLADAEPVDTTPVDAAPVETTPADAEPVDTTPVDAAPVETTPADAEPVDTTPVDAAPVDTTPIDTTENGVEITNDVLEDDDNSSGTFIGANNATEVWAEVVNILNEDRIDNLFGLLSEDLNFSDRIFNSNILADGIILGDNITVDPPYQFVEETAIDEVFDVSEATQFICTAGGQILSYDSPVISGADRVFENCVVGENEYRGIAGFRNFSRGAIGREPFIDFQRLASNGNVQTLDGEAFSGNRSLNNFVDFESGWRNLTFSDSSDGFSLTNFTLLRTAVDLSNVIGTFFSSEIVVVDGVEFSVVEHSIKETIDGQFTVRAPFTGGAPLNVSINLAFEDIVRIAPADPSLLFPSRDPAGLPFEWQAGVVTITADDGSSMRIQAIPGNSFRITLGTGETLGLFSWTGQFEIEEATMLCCRNPSPEG